MNMRDYPTLHRDTN